MNRRGESSFWYENLAQMLVVAVLIVIFVAIFVGFRSSTTSGDLKTATRTTFRDFQEEVLPELEKSGDSDEWPFFQVQNGRFFYGFNRGQDFILTRDGQIDKPKSALLCGQTNACYCICDKRCKPENSACRITPEVDNYYATFGDGDEDNKGKPVDGLYYLAIDGKDKVRGYRVTLIKENNVRNVVFAPLEEGAQAIPEVSQQTPPAQQTPEPERLPAPRESGEQDVVTLAREFLELRMDLTDCTEGCAEKQARAEELESALRELLGIQ